VGVATTRVVSVSYEWVWHTHKIGKNERIEEWKKKEMQSVEAAISADVRCEIFCG